MENEKKPFVILDGSRLLMTDDGVKYADKSTVSLEDALRKSSGSKIFSSISEALEYSSPKTINA